MKTRSLLTLILCLPLLIPSAYGQGALNYKLPSKAIIDIVDAPLTPMVIISPDKQMMLLMTRPGIPTIADLAIDELRLAGLRIDPSINGPSRQSYGTGIIVRKITGEEIGNITGFPADVKIGSVSFSDDSKKIAVTVIGAESIDLYTGDVASLKVDLIAKGLNTLFGSRFRGGATWLPDNKSLIFLSIPANRGPRPVRSLVPKGPVVQENMGKLGQSRTFQDMLQDPTDEALFEYFGTSEVSIWNGTSVIKLGTPAMYTDINISPDGKYLVVEKKTRPFSYIVPYSYFGGTTEIWNVTGEKVKTLLTEPLRENLPRGYDMVYPGPRSYSWRPDRPSTLYWVEALDGGDYSKEMEYHDQVYTLDAPFTGTPAKFIATTMRYQGITWGKEDFALINEGLQKTRVGVVSSFNPSKPEGTVKKIFENKMDDRYNNPGRFIMERNNYGRNVLFFADKGKSLFLTGQGASSEGDRPFLDKYRVADGKITRMWRSEAPYFENVDEILNIEKGLILTNRQSVNDPPNYFIRDLKSGKLTMVTDFTNPYPGMAGVTKELVTYKRKDGIDLSFTLYLPAGYNKEKDGPLPTILWAYPREFNDADAAGQVSGSPYTFTRVSILSVLVYVTEGYAVLNDAAFPIVGADGQESNDTFVEQLVANAEAAIDKAVEMGVTDRNRVAVSGHSYGAFMTANLLSHTRLFAAGIARSGAYNRTLTPFGFQNERRSYWEAPDIYNTMSPFMNADKVKDPLMLIHGMADNNSGTFPIQSERYFAALKGFGATTRLVMLPYESHGYAARESALHMHWEFVQWLDKYVKNKK